MPEPLDVTNIAEGTVVADKFRVVSTIGVGGMGAVVACDDLERGTPVALKFLLPDLLSHPGVTERFLREARASTALESDHVVKVLDVDTLEDGLPFMVMELLEGEDLARLIDGGRPFAIEEAIDFVVQAGDALAEAHRRGIVHRDIKPANLFLVETGEAWPIVKVLDFGISKLLGGEGLGPSGSLTKTSTVLGSGAYMSPEQIRSAKKVDHRTDIYALGVTLYELLTHKVPFQADGFGELTLKICAEPPDPIRKHREEIPEALAATIEKALARSPADRFQSIASFVVALAPFAAAETIPRIESIARAAGEPFTPAPNPDASPFSKTQAIDTEALLGAAPTGAPLPTSGSAAAAAPKPATAPAPTASPTSASPTAPARAAAQAVPFVPLTETIVMDSSYEAVVADIDARAAGGASPTTGAAAKAADDAGAKPAASAGADEPDFGTATMLLDVDSPAAAPNSPSIAKAAPAPGELATAALDDEARAKLDAPSPWRAKATEVAARRPAPAQRGSRIVGWVVALTVVLLAAGAIVAAVLFSTPG